MHQNEFDEDLKHAVLSYGHGTLGHELAVELQQRRHSGTSLHVQQLEERIRRLRNALVVLASTLDVGSSTCFIANEALREDDLVR